ncbi:uncharacterized protein Z519_01320 [Cladophialophora bantiana CBS 173.52]|uniref:NADP-dependent oxidoreductase domain-containing protein n=1 Tax=Cladophialophora bantiana (strain ATCC 10958 / CBS 173.52 / CDC B-1940 / NIH 8579) TaxID=1442370 RepID=A0A0D2F6B0_CLAB1|nr:uncharacterized protein Z519_01320 [Cladophialophora bantiana CBS 173.52]KIW97736.1 hypothetical protein Z519_01320 [Cladophialophora bantiana CBS 173.52]
MSLLRRHRQLAPTASVQVSPLCLGAMAFGEKQPERYGEVTKDTAFVIMDHFYSQGSGFIDTVNAYQFGQLEKWVGKWMASRKNCDEIVLATEFFTGYCNKATWLCWAGGGLARQRSVRSHVKPN